MYPEAIEELKRLGLSPTPKKARTPLCTLASKIKIMRKAKTISQAKYMLQVLKDLECVG